jgi:predicted flap endonuclease-1-like 5' DNA nuclease
MKNIAYFVLGVLAGWLVKWILDWFYWRGRIQKVAEENAELMELIPALEDEPNRRPEPSVITPFTKGSGRDNLQVINGIGPVFSKRLNEAGVTTFEQLSNLTTKDMEKILGRLFKRFFSEDNTIIAQAREFAEQKARSR